MTHVLLAYLEQASNEQYYAGFEDMGQKTKISLNHQVAYRAADGVPKVLMVDAAAGYSPYWDLHFIFWKSHDSWEYQELGEFPRTFQVMQARISVSQDGMPEVGVFYDSSRGSGSPVPVFCVQYTD